MRLFFILLFTTQMAVAQQKIFTDCNTIFVCIDSTSYQQLFTNPYIKDSLFFCKEISSRTTVDAYTGKYLIGKSATIEFFKPSEIDKMGNHLNDFGIEFKTRAFGGLAQLFKKALKLTQNIDTSTTILNDGDTSVPWYKTLSIQPKKANFEWSILEYQISYLQYIGFEKEALTQPMTYADFNKKISNGSVYPRQFNTIKGITLQIDSASLFHLNIFCTLNGLRKYKKSFYNKDVVIEYEVVKAPQKPKLKKISFELINPQQPRVIKISDNIQCIINQKRGELVLLN